MSRKPYNAKINALKENDLKGKELHSRPRHYSFFAPFQWDADISWSFGPAYLIFAIVNKRFVVKCKLKETRMVILNT